MEKRSVASDYKEVDFISLKDSKKLFKLELILLELDLLPNEKQFGLNYPDTSY